MKIKPQIRILGIDDCPFSRSNRQVQIIGTVFRAGEYMDGLLSTKISVDGEDSTEKIIQMIKKSRTSGQLRLIMLDGIALGGFNVVDINRLWKETKLPVIVVIRQMPDFTAIKSALKKVKGRKEKLALIEKAGRVKQYSVDHKELGYKGRKIYFQPAGIDEQEARKVLKLTIQHGLIPEPLRVAHLIASGIKFGESRGRA